MKECLDTWVFKSKQTNKTPTTPVCQAVQLPSLQGIWKTKFPVQVLQWNVESQKRMIYCVGNGILLNYKMTFLWDVALLFVIDFRWFMGCYILLRKEILNHIACFGFFSSSSIPSPFSDLPQSHHKTGRKWVISVAVPWAVEAVWRLGKWFSLQIHSSSISAE